MREIIFRGKRKDTGEWVQGLLWKKKYKTNKLFIGFFPYVDDDEEVAVVIPETVGQYIGKKDKNGKRIFEGDIITVALENSNGESWEENKGVHYNSDECCWYPMRWNEECDFCDGWTEIKSVEVIGNIHDNPELLEAKK